MVVGRLLVRRTLLLVLVFLAFGCESLQEYAEHGDAKFLARVAGWFGTSAGLVCALRLGAGCGRLGVNLAVLLKNERQADFRIGQG